MLRIMLCTTPTFASGEPFLQESASFSASSSSGHDGWKFAALTTSALLLLLLLILLACLV
jgi:hypothetical protein